MGDVVVVINASKLEITQKRLDEKKYYKHSNYPGWIENRWVARPDASSS